MRRLRFTILAVSLCLAAPAAAAVKPHALFDNHMVLQRNVPLPIWGTADPGEEVYVHLVIKTPDGKREEGQTVKADKDGKWMAKLAAFPAGADGVLTIRGEEKRSGPKSKANPNVVVFKDVAVGEVWVCSGQSNMEMSLAACTRGGGPQAIKTSANPNLRVFTVPKFAQPTPQSGFNPHPFSKKFSHWLPSQPDNAPMFSAVAYWFGRDLQKALNVPVGLIHTSWGGTPAQAWTSLPVLAAEPSLKYYADDLERGSRTTIPKKPMRSSRRRWPGGKQQPTRPKKPANLLRGGHVRRKRREPVRTRVRRFTTA